MPGTERQVTSPPIARASRREIVRPRPAPERAGAVLDGPCSNASKMRSMASGGMPSPLSLTRKRSRPSVIADGQAHAAVRRELQRVADQVVQHLLDARRVHQRGRGQAQVEHHLERQAALLGHRLQQVGDVAHRLRDQRGLRVQLDAVELDAREIEQVADDGDQVLGGVAQHVQPLALQRRQRLDRHQLRHADDAVQRRAQLVAHRGQEARLGGVGVLGVDQRAMALVGDGGVLEAQPHRFGEAAVAVLRLEEQDRAVDQQRRPRCSAPRPWPPAPAARSAAPAPASAPRRRRRGAPTAPARPPTPRPPCPPPSRRWWRRRTVGRNSTVSRPQVNESSTVPTKKRFFQAARRSARWRSRRNRRPSTMRATSSSILSATQVASSALRHAGRQQQADEDG